MPYLPTEDFGQTGFALQGSRIIRADWICPPPPGSPASGHLRCRTLRTLGFCWRYVSNPVPNPDKQKRPAFKLTVSVSGRLDLNQRLQVPQTCTLNPCATARCCVLGRTSRKIAQQGSLVNKAFCPYSHLMSFLSEQHPIFPLLRLFSVGDPFSGNQILSVISATFRGTIQYQSL